MLNQQRRYYKLNKQRIKARRRAALDADPAKKAAFYKDVARRVLAHYHRNKAKILPQRVAYQRKRRKEDPAFRVRCAISSRLWCALNRKGHKTASRSGIGCTREHLWQHLESNFKPGMTRDNYGKVWQVDHILPLGLFNLSDRRDMAFACHWKNLQPLFSADNLSKSNKITPAQGMLVFMARQFSLIS